MQVNNLLLLNLSHNKITTISTYILPMVNLHELLLCENKIVTITDKLLELSKLFYTYAFTYSYPCGFSKLSDISTVKRDRIIAYPTIMTPLYNLQILNLSFNNIVVIPKELDNCKNLHTLSLRKNPVSKTNRKMRREKLKS